MRAAFLGAAFFTTVFLAATFFTGDFFAAAFLGADFFEADPEATAFFFAAGACVDFALGFDTVLVFFVMFNFRFYGDG